MIDLNMAEFCDSSQNFTFEMSSRILYLLK